MPLSVTPVSGLFLSQFLTTNGDGTGVADATGDFSGAATDFFIEPQGQQTLLLDRVLIHIEDAGQLDAGRYGNGIALTNGIQILITENDITLLDFTSMFRIFTNGDWTHYAISTDLTNFGMGNNFFQTEISFQGHNSHLQLFPGQQLRFRLNDDFTGLVSQTFLIQGDIF